MGRHALVLAALAAASCGADAAVEETQEPERARETSEWMRTHFRAGRAIRDALVRGEVEEARAMLAEVSREPGPSDAPAEWAPRLEALRAAARRAATARGLPDVARDFAAAVASQCAACHEATGAEPSFDSPALPPAASDAPAPMQRHQFAAEQMWQGLVGPAPLRYREGARVLAEAPLHPAELVVGQAPPAEVVALSERVRDIAGRASRAEAQESRAALYGELLATCAACHGQLDPPAVTRAEGRSRAP